MSVWILFVFAILGGEPSTDSRVYTTAKSCETAQVLTIANLVSHNIQTGSVTCTKIDIGSFT